MNRTTIEYMTVEHNPDLSAFASETGWNQSSQALSTVEIEAQMRTCVATQELGDATINEERTVAAAATLFEPLQIRGLR